MALTAIPVPCGNKYRHFCANAGYKLKCVEHHVSPRKEPAPQINKINPMEQSRVLPEELTLSQLVKNLLLHKIRVLMVVFTGVHNAISFLCILIIPSHLQHLD
jgi:hypothetical protein